MEWESIKWSTEAYNPKTQLIAEPVPRSLQLNQHCQIVSIFKAWKLVIEVQIESQPAILIPEIECIIR